MAPPLPLLTTPKDLTRAAWSMSFLGVSPEPLSTLERPLGGWRTRPKKEEERSWTVDYYERQRRRRTTMWMLRHVTIVEVSVVETSEIRVVLLLL